MKPGVWDWEGKYRGHSDTLATNVLENDFMNSTAYATALAYLKWTQGGSILQPLFIPR